jgi:hypothetical protein
MGKVAQIKTKPTTQGVEGFLARLPDEQQRADSLTILQMMETATGEKPKMWGATMVGFGDVRYKSPKTGREVDWFKIGFAPRKANLSLHLIGLQRVGYLLDLLGKYKTGMGCLYINKLADVDANVLQQIISAAATGSSIPTVVTSKKVLRPKE